MNKNTHLEIDKSTEITQKVCELLESDASIADIETPTMEALKFLWNQTNLLYDLVHGRPEKEGRSGRDYFDGVKLGELAYQIALRLRKRGLKFPEEIALRVRLKALLQVQGHYHHIIGPAMIEHSELLEKLGRNEEASANYDCIISDFSWLISGYAHSNDLPNEEDSISIHSLYMALTQRLKFDVADSERKIIEEKIRKIRSLLSLDDGGSNENL
jgi:hypothetical protein